MPIERFKFPTPAKLRIVLRDGGEILVDGLRWTADDQLEAEKFELLDTEGNAITWIAVNFAIGPGMVFDFTNYRPAFAPS